MINLERSWTPCMVSEWLQSYFFSLFESLTQHCENQQQYVSSNESLLCLYSPDPTFLTTVHECKVHLYDCDGLTYLLSVHGSGDRIVSTARSVITKLVHAGELFWLTPTRWQPKEVVSRQDKFVHCLLLWNCWFFCLQLFASRLLCFCLFCKCCDWLIVQEL